MDVFIIGFIVKLIGWTFNHYSWRGLGSATDGTSSLDLLRRLGYAFVDKLRTEYGCEIFSDFVAFLHTYFAGNVIRDP